MCLSGRALSVSLRPISCSASPRRRQLASSSVLSFCQLAPQVPTPGYRHPVELPRKECARSREEHIGGARDGTLGPAARYIGLAPPSSTHRRGSGIGEDRPAISSSIQLLRDLIDLVLEAARHVLTVTRRASHYHRCRLEESHSDLGRRQQLMTDLHSITICGK